MIGTSASGGRSPADLIDLGADLGQGLGGVVVEFQADGDGGDALGALRFQVINAVGRGNGPFQRGGDEAPHQFGAGPDIDGGDGDRRVLAAGVLADIEGAHGLQPGNDDEQADHHGEDGAADEEIGEFHGSWLWRFSCYPAWDSG